ncbi:MAG: PilZ domain-containing protein [Gammaproteobacteria bacterium]|nr:PilZ domain-containing protein [Gammaproteobacteria bacterium]
MSSSEWNIVAVKDLSAGGIMFNYYKMNLGFGSILELKIDSIKSRPIINCIGRVVRVEDAHVNSMCHIATVFTEINEQDREVINTSVEAILKREEWKSKSIYPKMLTKITSAGTILKREVKIKKSAYSEKNKKVCSGLQMKIKNFLANLKPLRIILHGW